MWCGVCVSVVCICIVVCGVCVCVCVVCVCRVYVHSGMWCVFWFDSGTYVSYSARSR